MTNRKDLEQIFTLGAKPLIMGILNLDPDSFYSESIAHSEEKALIMVESKIQEGMDILDIGAFSSRPGAKIPTENAEYQLIIPILEKIRATFPDLPISIDTMRASVAQRCLDLGADMINDISGGAFDHDLPILMAKNQAIYIAMHMKGIPENMQRMDNTTYINVVEEVLKYFQQKIALFKSMGLHKLIIDPGFGFSKKLEDNYELLRNISVFSLLEKPILVGISRKSMIWKVSNTSAQDALIGSIVAGFYALLNSCTILRVHDIRETTQMLQVFYAIQNSNFPLSNNFKI